jgi:CRISPR-associated protein Csb2
VNQDQTVSVEPPGAKPAAKGKRGGKKASSRKSLEDQYPADLVACLEVDTTWLEANGWSQPPGARSALYWRNRDALEVGALSPRIQPPRARPVEAMLLALATQSGNMHALPTVARTLPQAELLHRALVRHILRIAPDQHETLTGRDEQRVPLEGHQHLHILPLDLDADGHLEHVLIWAPMGLNGASQEAVRAVRETFTKGGVGELRVALAGAGALDDMRTLQGPSGDTLRKILGPSDGARVWESATPFVAPRHIKKSGRGTVEGQISDELSSRSLPAPSAISIFNPQDEKSRSLRHIVRRRVRGPLPLVDFGFALRLEFAQPVQGPICLGYASHFGLGRFVAVE